MSEDRVRSSDLEIGLSSSEKTVTQEMWNLECVWKHKSLFRPPIKKLRIGYFYFNLSKCETKANEAQ